MKIYLSACRALGLRLSFLSLLLLTLLNANRSQAQTGNLIYFAGRYWVTTNGQFNPGNNYWSNDNAYVDPNTGYLHLKITQVGNTWYCAQVETVVLDSNSPSGYKLDSLGSGVYQIQVEGQLDQLGPSVVFGMFNYPGGAHDGYDEMDIEYGRTISLNNNILNFTAHTQYGYPNNGVQNEQSVGKDISLNGTYTTNIINRKYDQINYQVIGGFYNYNDNQTPIFSQTFYNTANVTLSKTSMPFLINLYLHNAIPPLNNVEVIIHDFKFIPDNCSESLEPNDQSSVAPPLFTNPLNQVYTSANIQSVISTASDQDWYAIPIDGNGTLNINLSNLPADYDMELYPSNGLAGGALKGSYNSGTTNENISYTYSTPASTTLYVKIYPKNNTQFSACNKYSLGVNWVPAGGNSVNPPPNDNCSQAILLTSSTSLSYLSNQTVNNATASGKPKANADAYTGTPSLDDVWYYFQAAGTSTTITVDPNGSALDAVIAAYNSCSDNNEVGSSDTPGGNGGLSTLTIPTTPGNYYYIRIYDYGGTNTTNGGFRIGVTYAASDAPSLTTTAGCNGTSSQISLSWTPVPAAIGYDIYRNSAYLYTTFTASQGTQYQDNDVTPGITYTYYVTTTTSSVPSNSQIVTALNCSSGSSCTPITLGSSPTDQTTTSPTTVSFSCSASAGTNIAFQWQYSIDGGNTWMNVPNSGPYYGANTFSLQLNYTDVSMNGYQYRCYLSNSCSSLNTSEATLTVNPPCTSITLGSNPTDQAVTVPTTVSFSCSASAGTNIAFQWQYSTDGGNTWMNVPNSGPYSGANTFSLQINYTDMSMNGYLYRCYLSNSCSSLNTNDAALAVRFDLPANNFQISVTSATCVGAVNGSINITASQSLSYTATVTANGSSTLYPFTTSREIDNLDTGTYQICITVQGQADYQQCYDVKITEPKPLSVYSVVDNTNNTINLTLNGGTTYNIQLNGLSYTTSNNAITLPLQQGRNKLTVTTDKLCQGTYQNIIDILTAIQPYPEPFESVLNVDLGTEQIGKVLFEVHGTGDGKILYSKQFVNQSGGVQLDLSTLKEGVYILHIKLDNIERVYKIIKK